MELPEICPATVLLKRIHEPTEYSVMEKSVAIIIGATILALAIVAAAFMFTHKSSSPAPPGASAVSGLTPEIACLQGGGTWMNKQFPGMEYCQH